MLTATNSISVMLYIIIIAFLTHMSHDSKPAANFFSVQSAARCKSSGVQSHLVYELRQKMREKGTVHFFYAIVFVSQSSLWLVYNCNKLSLQIQGGSF